MVPVLVLCNMQLVVVVHLQCNTQRKEHHPPTQHVAQEQQASSGQHRQQMLTTGLVHLAPDNIYPTPTPVKLPFFHQLLHVRILSHTTTPYLTALNAASAAAPRH
jgi:hypothetical protein